MVYLKGRDFASLLQSKARSIDRLVDWFQDDFDQLTDHVFVEENQLDLFIHLPSEPGGGSTSPGLVPPVPSAAHWF